MKILVYGAGVIGSIYAAKLHRANCNVTLLARDRHYESLKKNGVIIKDELTGELISSKMPLTAQLGKYDFYDLVIVTVRLDQIETVIPALRDNDMCRFIMFMLNYPGNIDQLTNQLPGKHIVLGFPGVGGTYKNNLVEYIQIKQQKTTIGEINGEFSDRIKEVKTLLELAEFKVEINSNMQAWLKTHALFVACVAAAIARENGDSIQLGKNRGSVQMMIKSIREGFTALKTLGIPITPSNLKIIFMIMPQWFSILYWQKTMKSAIGILAIAPHANAAKGEMKLLANKILTIIHSSAIPTPTLDKLLSDFQ